MKKRMLGAIAPMTLSGNGLSGGQGSSGLQWLSLPSLPDRLGFAGMYAGVSGGALLAAGGANFSERPHAEGGRKIWHDRIFVLSAPDGDWREVGRLPRPSAYGMSATWRDAVVCVGGGDAGANFADAWLMRWDGRSLSDEPPPLPQPLADATAILVGDLLYVVGGRDTPNSPDPLARMVSLDLSAKPAQRRWENQPWPDGAVGRIQVVAGVHDGELFHRAGHPHTHGPLARDLTLSPDLPGKGGGENPSGAGRRRAHCGVEPHRPGRQGVERGCAHDGVAGVTGDRRIVLVRHDRQNVRSGRFRRSLSCSRPIAPAFPFRANRRNRPRLTAATRHGVARASDRSGGNPRRPGWAPRHATCRNVP